MIRTNLKTVTWNVALLAVILCVAEAEAVTYHVSPFGSNTPPYNTYAKAATDPRAAIDSASGYGDTVLIHAGDYTLNSEVQLPAGLDVIGIDRDSVRLVWNTNDRSATMLQGHGDHSVSGITFVNVHGSADLDANALAVALTNGGLILWNCRFDWMRLRLFTSGRCEVFGTEFLAHAGYGILVSESGELYVHGNFFWGGSNFSEGGYGIDVNGGGEIVIENNFLDWSGTGKHGLPLWIDNPGYGHVTIRNNIVLGGQAAIWWFYGNGAVENNLLSGPDNSSPYQGMDVFDLVPEDTLRLRNNIFLDITWSPLFSISCPSCFTGPILYTHNAFWPPRDSFFVIPPIAQGRVLLSASDNFNAFPMFTPDTTFRLQYGSPLIDAGDPSILDVDGSRSDIGPKGGPWGSTYVYPDLAPIPPETVIVAGESTALTVSWSHGFGTDLAGYHLIRGVVPGFWSPGAVPLADLSPADTSRQDTLPPSVDSAFYVVTTFDVGGQSSGPSQEIRYLISEHPANRAPVIVDIPPQTVDAGDTLILTISASDPDGDAITLTALNLPALNDTFIDYHNGSGLFAFTPDESQVGDHTIQFVASDGRLADTTDLVIHVHDRPVNHPPMIAAIPEQNVDVGDTLNVPISASDPDGDAIMLTALNLPALNAAFIDHSNGSGLFAFTPDTSQIGDHTIQIVASDGRLTDTAEFVVDVHDTTSTPLPGAPRILRVYPNPMNGTGVIDVAIPDIGGGTIQAEVVLLDLLGRRVTVLYSGALAGGVHSLPCDPSVGATGRVASGIYFVQLHIGSKSAGPPVKVALIK